MFAQKITDNLKPPSSCCDDCYVFFSLFVPPLPPNGHVNVFTSVTTTFSALHPPHTHTQSPYGHQYYPPPPQQRYLDLFPTQPTGQSPPVLLSSTTAPPNTTTVVPSTTPTNVSTSNSSTTTSIPLYPPPHNTQSPNAQPPGKEVSDM